MSDNSQTTGRRDSGVCRAILFVASLLALSLCAGTARAQSQYGSTPQALAPGSPAGSYALSGFDDVNLFNGRVNIHIPVLGVGGRGGAKGQIFFKASMPTPWQVRRDVDPFGQPLFYAEPGNSTPDNDGLIAGRPILYGVQSGDGFQDCPGSGYANYTSALTRLFFVEPDGTQHELRDRLTGGRPLPVAYCTLNPQHRGTVFVSTDGSGVTFVADAQIADAVLTGDGYPYVFPSGDLFLKDGTRIRFADDITVRDRNGNLLTYSGNFNIQVTDSLNRGVQLQNVTGTQCTSLWPEAISNCEKVSYKGFGGSDRAAWIAYDDNLRQSRIVLPNGLSYRFYYNDYSDLIRIDLPTGGSVEYTYEAGLTGQQPSYPQVQWGFPGLYALRSWGVVDNPFVFYRRVTERRVYKEGHVLESRQTFSKPEDVSGTNLGYVDKSQYDAGGTLLFTERHYFYGSAAASFNVSPTSYEGWKSGREHRTEVYDAGGTLLRQTDQTWEQRAPVSWWTGNPDDAPPNDPRVMETVTRLENNLTSKTTYGFDPNVGYNSLTDVYEYDFGAGGPGALLRHMHTDHVTTASYTALPAGGGVYLRDLPSEQWVSADLDGANKVSLTVYGYDEFALDDRPNITGHDPAYSTGYVRRGNVTSVTRYASAAARTGAVTTTSHYDIAGNVVSTTDAKGDTTQLSYADSFCNDGGTRCNGTYTPNTYAFATTVSSPVPDVSTAYGYPSGTFGSTSSLTLSRVYDFYTGLVYSTTDANNQTTRTEYADPLDRPTAQVLPGPDGGRTDIIYAADGRSIHVLSDLDGSRRLESYEYYDGLGRTVRRQQYENADAAKPWITVDTEYDALGRVKRTSSPYRWTLGTFDLFSTSRWIERNYDALNRVLTATTRPDGSTTSTDYSGDRVLTKDAAGRERVGRSDALGRMTEVWEVTAQESGAEASTVALASFPSHPETAYGYLTSYKYDPLGNLRMVEQAGQHLGQRVTQRRFFAYDALGRLLRVKNPEQGGMTADTNFSALTDSTSGVSNSQWSVGYAYDANGNVAKRKDARNVVTSYQYDHLDRLVITSYANDPAQTPTAYRHYDGSTNGRGRLWYSSAGVSATGVNAYDEVGRIREQHQNFLTGANWSAPYSVQLVYNKAGKVTSQVYPSGHTVTYNYDAAGRPGDYNGQAAVAGDLGDGVPRTYASEVRYHELGGMEQERFGTATPVYNKSLFNGRGQLAEIRVSTHSILSPGHETDWNRGAIINHYSTSGWGATGGGADNNGNLLRQEVYVPDNDQIVSYTNVVQEYGYDSLNRLNAVFDKPFNGAADFYQLYKYDRWGNRTIDAASWQAPAPQFSVDAATNRLGVPAGQAGAMNYDAAGNLVNDSYTGYGDPTGQQQTRFYEAEGRMISAVTSSSQTATYTYDADGRRIKRNAAAGGEVWQVYGAGGELLAEYAANASPASPQKEYGYRGGELLVTAEPASGSAQGGGAAYNGVPASVPGKVEAELFDAGGEGSAYHDTTAGTHGQDYDQPPSYPPPTFRQPTDVDLYKSSAGYSNSYLVVMQVGDWMDYTADVAQAGSYTLQARVAWGGGPGGLFHVEVDGVDRTGPVQIPDTGWALQTVTEGGVQLPAGRHVIRVVADSNAANGCTGDLDYLRLVADSEPGLLGHWRFDEGAGATAADSSGGGNTGTLQGGAGWGAGRSGAATALDGADDYVQVGSQPSLVMTGALTVSAWVYPTGGGSGGAAGGIIVNKEGEYELARFQDGTVRWAIANQSPGWDWVNTGYVAPLNQWTHITFTYDGSGGKTYANGQLAHTAAATGAIGDTIPSQNEFRVGGRQAVPQNFAGRVDEVRVYGRALTAQEAAGLWAAGQPAGVGASVRWLVSDQLGTPRMVVDQTGSLAGVTRHDYLPFGEEIPADNSWRIAARGYGAADGVRQKFTGYERDDESGLDYAQARYYANSQGRFTSADPLLASASPGAPQTWNRYAYVGNNPLTSTDPTGLAENGVDDPDVQGTPANSQQQQRQQQSQSSPPAGPPPIDSSLSGSPEYVAQEGMRQVVDVRQDPAIVSGVANIHGTPLPQGTAPLLSDVIPVVGTTTFVQDGAVIDGYGNVYYGYTGTIRPVAYVPVDQGGNPISQTPELVLQEDVHVVIGEQQTTSGPAPQNAAGIFFDLLTTEPGSRYTVANQYIQVDQIRGGFKPFGINQSSSRVTFETNRITKDSRGTIDVRLGQRHYY